MSNEYLKKLEYLGDYLIGNCKLKSHTYYKELYKYLETIENANPSEALKCLVNLRKSANTFCQHMPEQCELNKKYADTIEQALLEAQEDKQFIELILNKPQLLNVFAFDGIHTWEEFEDTFSDEDKKYINTTKEEYEYMRKQLIKRGKIDE